MTKISSQSLLPQITVIRKPPFNLKANDEAHFKHEYQKIFPPVKLWQLKNVNITNEGIVFNRLKIFKQNLNTNEYNSHLKLYKYLAGKYLKYKRKKIVTRFCLAVFDSWSNGYFHWMCDVLPKLALLESTHSDCHILLPEDYTSAYISETLKHFDFKGIERIPKKCYANVSDLYVCEKIAPSGNYNPQIMHMLRDKFLSKNINKEVNGNERIYISRSKVERRKILNEDQMIPLLEKYGFKVIHFEDYSLSQQIEIARNSKYLVGLHGAGLTNIMFMNSNSSVLELKAENDRTNHCYFSIASVMDINYFYLFCKQEDITKSIQDGNVFINVKQLEEELDFMLSVK